MTRTIRNNKGFTLIELVMVVAMVGVLASIATPSYLEYAQRARATQCHVDRGEIQNKIVQYYHDNSDTELQSLQQLVTDGYLESVPACPLEGGLYLLIPAEQVHTPYPAVACSLHYLPETASSETSAPPEEPETPEEPDATDEPEKEKKAEEKEKKAEEKKKKKAEKKKK